MIVATEAAVDRAITQVARTLVDRTGGRQLTLVPIMNGGLWFAARLGDTLWRLGHSCDFGSIVCRTYGKAQSPEREPIPNLSGLPDTSGRVVVLIDDVLDSGATMIACLSALKFAGVDPVITAVLVDRCHAKLPFTPIAAFRRPGISWLYGCGMDADGTHRNVPELMEHTRAARGAALSTT